jgi:catechol 2,3-dioxygenase-like lactoylglutathione lyase family enzyme
VLQVQRVLETVHFYQDVLGFRCDYRTETYGVV